MADVLRDLRRRQLIRQQDGRWVIAEDLSALERELPESVRSLIQRKIDALDDADRRLLAAASVQGLDFDSAIVARALRPGRGRGRRPARAAGARARARALRRTSTSAPTAR